MGQVAGFDFFFFQRRSTRDCLVHFHCHTHGERLPSCFMNAGDGLKLASFTGNC